MSGTPEKATRLMKSASLLLTVAILLPLLAAPAVSVVFSVQSDRISGLEKSSGQLRKMVFTSEEFERLEFEREGREFCLGGEMYDIHSVIRAEGKVTVLALRDQAETGIRKAAAGGGNPAVPAAPHHVMLFMPYFFTGTADFGLSPVLKGEILLANLPGSCPDRVDPVTSPPPEWPADYCS